tara:strand:+ start:4474 stop:5139 length:666 start_codon:yes stop_codon:yes gene_type:complete
MHNVVNNLLSIQNELKIKIKKLNFENYNPNIVAVSKTFAIKDVIPLINHGHLHFGENKVKEAIEKWTDIKNDFKNIKLHMIGKLQTNKVKYVIPLFDYIHSVDSLKLAEKISTEEIKKNKKMKLFIQINIGNENQKSGISVKELDYFYNVCKNDLGLNIIGLMCLPPNDNKSSIYFSQMKELVSKLKLKEISMGMSNDYLEATNYKTTYLRIGSKIFGERS